MLFIRVHLWVFHTTPLKAFLLEDKSDAYPDGVKFVDEVMDELKLIDCAYADGERYFPVFTGHLKDEAVPIAKVVARKCRLFTAAPVAWSLKVRKELLTFVRVMQKNPFIFEAGPGTVCQSKQWGVIRDYLCQFGEDRIVGGDYSKFDKKMIADFILAAFDIIINILRAAGRPECDLLAVQCIAFDIAFPLCNISGDLVEFFGTNPSGHPLTVIINSLVNSLYVRYAYRTLNPNQEVVSFKKHIALFTYGDDNTMGVSELVPWFDHTTLQQALANIGVEYTMADKVSESKPYIHIDTASFLKRAWRWDADVEAWLCPLEEESIIKSLTMWVPSASVDAYSQITDVIGSAVQEYFFYGREKFDAERKFFQTIMMREPFVHYIKESTFPTFDVLKERFHKASQ